MNVYSIASIDIVVMRACSELVESVERRIFGMFSLFSLVPIQIIIHLLRITHLALLLTSIIHDSHSFHRICLICYILTCWLLIMNHLNFRTARWCESHIEDKDDRDN